VFLDHLTIGSLTAGRLVAATGVVDLGGGVADIGSVELKTQAALAAGADVLFVPHHQIRAATTAADAYRPGNDLTVVGVASVIAAVRWLCTSGGEASGVCD
jgi:PDZ domain-containing secreted protein